MGLSQEDPSQPNPKQKFSPKKLFSLIKNARQDSSGVAPLMCPKRNITFSDTPSKTEILNSQFQSVFTPTSPLRLDQICTEKLDIDYPIMPDIKIDLNGISKLLSNLNPSKAAGPDALKPIILKNLNTTIAPIIQILFQKSLETGQLPSDWTKANVCPIFKKGSRDNPANYRPISLTCILCKVMEHIIASNICDHFRNNNILYDLQHGFRDGRSCETQLVQLNNDLAKNLDEGQQTDLILLDFSKAFDKVSHLKLIHKLHQHGIQNSTLNWIKSFLIGRSQAVILDGHSSSKVPVTSRVPGTNLISLVY